MKSLLVDALRQANDRDSEVKLGESDQLERTSVDSANSDGEKALPEPDSLELMETTKGLAVATEVAQESENSSSTLAGTNLNAADIETGMQQFDPAADYATATGFRPGSFERYAVWTPIVCLLLSAAAAGSYSAWNRLIGDVQNADLRTLSTLGYAKSSSNSRIQSDAPPARFPLAEVGTASTESPVDTMRNSTPTMVGVSRSTPTTASKSPAKTLFIARNQLAPTTVSLNVPTFTTLDAAYQAHLFGDLSKADFETVVAKKIDEDAAAAASEIKLLLQRYPEEASLHFALGSLHATSSRWPEARMAFEQARAMDVGNPSYVFNLAVSLERLGNHTEAQMYYDSAIRLARAVESKE